MPDRIRRLFRRCDSSRNPVLSFAKASAKVGYLARQGRPQLHGLENALNEQKHMVLALNLGRPDLAAEHGAARNVELAAFARAIRNEIIRSFVTQQPGLTASLFEVVTFGEALPPAEETQHSDTVAAMLSKADASPLFDYVTYDREFPPEDETCGCSPDIGRTGECDESSESCY